MSIYESECYPECVVSRAMTRKAERALHDAGGT